MSLKISRNSCLRHAPVFFCLLLVMSSMNLDVCSIAFAMYLLNGVLFRISFYFLMVRNCIVIELAVRQKKN